MIACPLPFCKLLSVANPKLCNKAFQWGWHTDIQVSTPVNKTCNFSHSFFSNLLIQQKLSLCDILLTGPMQIAIFSAMQVSRALIKVNAPIWRLLFEVHHCGSDSVHTKFRILAPAIFELISRPLRKQKHTYTHSHSHRHNPLCKYSLVTVHSKIGLQINGSNKNPRVCPNKAQFL